MIARRRPKLELEESKLARMIKSYVLLNLFMADPFGSNPSKKKITFIWNSHIKILPLHHEYESYG